MPFESNCKGVPEGRQGTAVVIILKNPTNTPVPDTINPRHADRLYGVKRPLRSAQGFLVALLTDQRHGVELGEGFSVTIANQTNADRLWVRIGR
jgi:hypothetical protein